MYGLIKVWSKVWEMGLRSLGLRSLGFGSVSGKVYRVWAFSATGLLQVAKKGALRVGSTVAAAGFHSWTCSFAVVYLLRKSYQPRKSDDNDDI